MDGIVQGQQMTISTIIGEVANTGYVNLYINQTNLTLIPAETIQLSQNQLITQIIDQVKKEGKIVLYENKTEFTLVLEE
jgi:hypothetical protein